MEDLRVWRDKNSKLEAAYQKEKETRENQKIKMAQIEEETNKYKSQLQKLKQANNQVALPPINKEDERKKLLEQLKAEREDQRKEII